MKSAKLERANLESANLNGANLERANLERANLENASLKSAKGLSIYDGLMMMSRLHRFGCFFVPPIFESYKVN